MPRNSAGATDMALARWFQSLTAIRSDVSVKPTGVLLKEVQTKLRATRSYVSCAISRKARAAPGRADG